MRQPPPHPPRTCCCTTPLPTRLPSPQRVVRSPITPSRPYRSDASSSNLSSITTLISSSPSERRRSRYGRDDFAPNLEFSARHSFRCLQSRAQKQKNTPDRTHDFLRHRHWHRQPNLVCRRCASSRHHDDDATLLQPTRTRDQRSMSLFRPRTCSPACPPAPVMTSPRRHSPTTTMTTNGQASTLTPSPQQQRNAPAGHRVQIHPFVISKSSTPPNASSQPHSSSCLRIQRKSG